MQKSAFLSFLALTLFIACQSSSGSQRSSGGDPASCPAGGVVCSGQCVSTESNPAHCGACGQACQTGALCAEGACVSDCPSGTMACGQACVDTTNDAFNCGSCDVNCAAGEQCQGGACIGASSTTTGSGGSTTTTTSTTSAGGTSSTTSTTTSTTGMAGSGGSGGTSTTTGGGGTGSMLTGDLTGTFPTTVSEADALSAYNTWRSNHVEDCGGGIWRVRFDNASQTVSEGIGYGMILAAVWEDDPTLVQGFFNYYQGALNERGLMAWLVEGCSLQISDPGGASDGDLDAAMGLILAECRWPGMGFGEGATSIINAIKEYDIIDVDGRLALLAGDAWGDLHCMNPSYLAPAYYRVFASHVPADAAFWNQMVGDTYAWFGEIAHATTGLVGEWAETDGSCGFGGAEDYGYNAARTPWRLATDYAWSGSSEAEAILLNVSSFVDSIGGVGSVVDGYRTDGSQQGGNLNSTFAGAFALSGLVRDQATVDAYHTDFLNVPANNDANYFQSTLRALYMTLSVQKFLPTCGQ